MFLIFIDFSISVFPSRSVLSMGSLRKPWLPLIHEGVVPCFLLEAVPFLRGSAVLLEWVFMYGVEAVGIHGFSQMGGQGAQPCLLRRPSFSTSCAGGPVSGPLVPFAPHAHATRAALLASDNLSLHGVTEWDSTERVNKNRTRSPPAFSFIRKAALPS